MRPFNHGKTKKIFVNIVLPSHSIMYSVFDRSRKVTAVGIGYLGISVPDNSGKVMTIWGLIDPALIPQLSKYGGYGFTFVHTRLFLYLRIRGICGQATRNIIKENSKRILTLVNTRDRSHQKYCG